MDPKDTKKTGDDKSAEGDESQVRDLPRNLSSWTRTRKFGVGALALVVMMTTLRS